MSVLQDFIAMTADQQAVQESGQTEIVADETTAIADQSTQASSEMDNAETTGAVIENTEVADPVVPEEVTVPEFDWSRFSDQSGGIIKDEESFMSVIDKAGKYEEVAKAKEELEKVQFKAANTYIETLNKLAWDGASKDQIKAFVRLNEVGDFDNMDAKELLVAHKVLLNKNSEDVAKFKVDTEFDLSDYDENSMEYKSKMDDMRIASEKAKSELLAYKAELSEVNNPDKQAAEQQRLEQIAQEKQFDMLVKQSIPSLSKSISTKTTIDLGEGKGSFDLSYSEDFNKKIPAISEEFVRATRLDPRDPATAEQLNGYIEMRYIAENRDKFYSDMYDKMSSKIGEIYANKYENRGGLPAEESNPNASASQDGYLDFLNKKVMRR